MKRFFPTVFSTTDDRWLTDTGFWYQPDIVEAAARAADPGWAAQAVKAYQAWADRSGQPWALAVAARCQGLADPAGDPEPHFTLALSWHQRADEDGRRGRPLETARTRPPAPGPWCTASGCGARRGAPRRPGHLVEAVRTFDALGAAAWAQRARRELAATGQSAARAQAPGLLSRLTPQEYQIITLAASGLSNREIGARLYLSHRTVSDHLYKAYPKLGISQRAELRGLIADAEEGTEQGR